MKIRYHIATISFSLDLVRADSPAIPVGILMLGESAAHSMALLALRQDQTILADLPPMIRSIVGDFPTLLRAQLEEILQGPGHESIDHVLRAFEDSLRNSFFVSDLRTDQVLEVPEVPRKTEPWKSAYPQVVAAVGERMVQADIPTDVRQVFRPWSNAPEQGAAA